MNVFEREDGWPLPGERREPGDDCVMQASAQLFGLKELEFLVASRQPEQVRDVWRRGRSKGFVQLACDFVVRLIATKPHKAAQQVSVRPVGERGTVREAASLEPAE